MVQRSPVPPPRRRDEAPTLNARDVDVLACLAVGKSTSQTAAALGISGNTARSRIRRVQRMLGASGREAAVRAAQEAGVLGIPRPRHPSA